MTGKDGTESAPPEAEDPETEPRDTPEPIARPPDTDGEDEGEQFTAVVREIERISASEVPTGYPVAIETAQALAVELTVEGTDEPVFVCYFEPADRGPDDRLSRLLGVIGADDDPETLVGRELLLTISEGYYVPVVPDDRPRGTPKAVLGIFAGLAPSAVIGLVGVFAPGAAFIGTRPFVAGWLVATFLLLPVSLYVDALYLRTTTNWTGGPRNWAVMAAVPGLNVLAVPLYLIARENADRLV
ncbi:hypothetical protein GRX03_10460 [Halovenus sp. WSH3]|uniref:Uncharacterized protein n=1 Tax=Halovenus carboxidivorans TaxID=2692199 RepID=A0A6B0TFQ5_9EURY|nr:hypothetical protein [Halovenus carboxidivorans]MXR52019.1 hypothetical protein [Halovenus carboxidivorans]